MPMISYDGDEYELAEEMTRQQRRAHDREYAKWTAGQPSRWGCSGAITTHVDQTEEPGSCERGPLCTRGYHEDAEVECGGAELCSYCATITCPGVEVFHLDGTDTCSHPGGCTGRAQHFMPDHCNADDCDRCTPEARAKQAADAAARAEEFERYEREGAPDGDLVCERCGRRTYSWAAEVCFWWPAGCRGEPRVCQKCQSSAEAGSVHGGFMGLSTSR